MRKCFEKNAHLLKGVKDKKVSEHNRCLFLYLISRFANRSGVRNLLVESAECCIFQE